MRNRLILQFTKERRSDAHGAHRYGTRPTTYPSSDVQCHRRRIFQWQHPPKALNIHRHALLLGQRQIQTRTISGVLDGWRAQSSRIFYQVPPHQPPSSTDEHISSPHRKYQQVCILNVTYLPAGMCWIPPRLGKRTTDGHSLPPPREGNGRRTDRYKQVK